MTLIIIPTLYIGLDVNPYDLDAT